MVVLIEAGVGVPLGGEPEFAEGGLCGFPVAAHGAADRAGNAEILVLQGAAENTALLPTRFGELIVVFLAEAGLTMTNQVDHWHQAFSAFSSLRRNPSAPLSIMRLKMAGTKRLKK